LAAGDKSTDPIDLVRFPNQNTIANYLRNHQETNSQVLADPRFIEAMSSAFADNKIPFSSVDSKVIAVVRNWQWHHQIGIPIHAGKSITENFR
jgi:hypothetical protein